VSASGERPGTRPPCRPRRPPSPRPRAPAPHRAVGRDASTPVTVRIEKVVSVALEARDISLIECTRPLPAPSALPLAGRFSCGREGAGGVPVGRGLTLPPAWAPAAAAAAAAAGAAAAAAGRRVAAGRPSPKPRAAAPHLGRLARRLGGRLLRLELQLALALHEHRHLLLLGRHGERRGARGGAGCAALRGGGAAAGARRVRARDGRAAGAGGQGERRRPRAGRRGARRRAAPPAAGAWLPPAPAARRRAARSGPPPAGEPRPPRRAAPAAAGRPPDCARARPSARHRAALPPAPAQRLPRARAPDLRRLLRAAAHISACTIAIRDLAAAQLASAAPPARRPARAPTLRGKEGRGVARRSNGAGGRAEKRAGRGGAGRLIPSLPHRGGLGGRARGPLPGARFDAG
jgi:hypothetical protein